MAEMASLTSAHSHVRHAAQELSRAHRKEASEEHKHAASDFSRAARGTSDSEALRVLKLLEEQHQRLARILQKDESTPVETSVTGKEPSSGPLVKRAENTTTNQTPSPESTANAKAKSPSSNAASRIGSQARESSPSLARDIASRRGIPPPGRGPPSAAALARSKQLSPESNRNRQSSQAGATANIPPSVVESQANLREARRAKKAEDDEGFAKFYSSLTTGTMSKLSSALAYAGLPLTADEIRMDQSSQKKTVTATNEPDVKKYISKAALDAVEYQHRERGTFGHGFGPAESFYMVQTGGGTYSYADITKNRHAHLSGIEEDAEDAFVDAREIPGPSSPKHSRFVQHSKQKLSSKGRTQEELELENETLKSTIDRLSQRLSNFEAHAQDASMAALTQSMISLRAPHESGADPALEERLRQLETQIAQGASERQQLEDRASKQAKMLKKYHSKWEELKTSAKEKDKAKKEKAERGGGGGGEDGMAAVGTPEIS